MFYLIIIFTKVIYWNMDKPTAVHQTNLLDILLLLLLLFFFIYLFIFIFFLIIIIIIIELWVYVYMFYLNFSNLLEYG